jgi:tRNA threonylcarbamoyladenosine biosynthesis protein TsaE
LKTLVIEKIVAGEKGTENLGRKLASILRPGDVVAMYGELGAGKTCLIRGVARGLGLEEGIVASPSFSLINEYPAEFPVYHIDCYRLHLREAVDELGLEEYFEGRGLCLIEWAERLEWLPDDRLDIFLEILDENRRRIRLEGYGSLGERLLGSRSWVEVS